MTDTPYTELTNEDFNALMFRAHRGHHMAMSRSQYAGNHGDSTDYRAMGTLTWHRFKGPYAKCGTYAQWRNFAMLSFAEAA